MATPDALVVADGGEMAEDTDPAASETVAPATGEQVPGHELPWRSVTVTVVPPLPREADTSFADATTVDPAASPTGWKMTWALWPIVTEWVVSVAE